jgi:hypothetical protein
MKTNSRFTRVAVASGLVVACGAAVLGITGFASAELAGSNEPAAVVVPAAGDTGTNSPDPSGTAASGSDAAGTASSQSVEGTAPAAGDTHAHGPRTPMSAANVAKALGMTEAELRTALQTKSFATIAGDKNVDIADVKTALLADLKAHLDAGVASGKHTQAEADAKLAAFTARIDTFVNNIRPGKGMGGKGMGRHGAPKFATEGLAGVLKLTVAEMNTQLKSGKTLADIAKAQNVDIADVKTQLLKDFNDKEQAEVASGEHTQAEVDAKVAEFKTRLDDIVNGVRPAGGPGMGGKDGKRGQGHGGRGHHGDMDGMPGAQGEGLSA